MHKRQSHLSNATHVRSKASKLFALFFIFLLTFPLFSQLQPIKAESQGSLPPYKVGDWLRYSTVMKYGQDTYEFITKVSIEEVSAMYVNYSTEIEDFEINGRSCAALFSLPRSLGSSVLDLSTATSPSGEILINPSCTGTYTFNAALNETYIRNYINNYINKTYGGLFYFNISFNVYYNGTVTYYKGVLTKFNTTITLIANIPMFAIEISLIGTSIEELKSEVTTLPPTLEIIDYQVFVQRELIKLNRSPENVYYPSFDTKALLSENTLPSSFFDVVVWLQRHPILLPTRGENFILAITVRNKGSFSLTIPSRLSYITEPGPEDLSKFNVRIEGPQLVEIAPIDKGSGVVVVDKEPQNPTLGPGEIKTIFYRCRVQWDFIPPSEVSILSPSDALGLIWLKFSFEGISTVEPDIIVGVSAQKQKINGAWVLFNWARSEVLATELEEMKEKTNPESIFLSSLSLARGEVSTDDIALYFRILMLPNEWKISESIENKIIHDPSPNYTQLVPPPSVPEVFSKLPNSTGSKALLYEYLYLSYLNASAESLARANGAREMNDTKYYYLQLKNAQMYAANASTYYNNLVPLLEQIVEELNKSGYINETSFIKGKEYIAKNGLPSNVTKLLTELGFTKYINISEVEEHIKNTKYEPLNVTAFNEALELSKKYNPAAFFNQSFAEELESVSNKTLCQVILNETGLSNATVKVDGKDYPLPTSLYLNLGTKHNITFVQVVPGLFYDYVFKELHVGNETFTNPSYQLTVLEPSSITAVYESRLSMLSIGLASTTVLALVIVAYFIKRNIYKFS